MATARELIYNIKNILRGGVQSDTELVSDRQVLFWINNTRSTLIRQDINKRRSISDNIRQSFCMDVSEVDASVCCGITVDCKVVRTDLQLPSFLESDHKDLLTKVGPVNILGPSFTLIPFNRAAWVGNNKYSKNGKYAFLRDGYIYLLGEDVDLITKISVEGVFEDPTVLADFIDCSTGSSCFSLDSEYPLSNWMIEPLTQMILASNGKVIVQSPTDVSGDIKHNVQPNTQK